MSHSTSARTHRPATRIALMGCVALSLAAASVVAPAVAAPPPAAGLTAGAPSVRATVSDLVPVLVTLGNDVTLRGAKVQAVDARGRVLQTATVNERGGATLSRAKVAKAVSLRVSGGTTPSGTRNNGTLSGPLALHGSHIRVQFVNPITTLVDGVATSRKISPARARRLVYRHMEIPDWVQPWQYSMTATYFSPKQFSRLVTRKGGVKQALASLQRDITAGSTSRSFGDPATESRGLASFAGEMLFTAVIEASTGQSPDDLIGSLMGVSDPTQDILTSIAQEIQTVINMLSTIEADMQEMLAEIEIAQYDTIAESMAPIVDATQNQWTNYNYLVKHVDPTDRETYQQYAEDFYDEINPNIGLFNSLFTTAGSTGLLDELYRMNATEYPWWTSSDVTNMQSTVDYYGTMQAEAVTLLSEAWNFSSDTYQHTKTKSYINGQLTGLYQTQSSNIYLSMPDDIDVHEVVNPANRKAFSLVAKQQKYGAGAQVYPGDCTPTGSTTWFTDIPAILPGDQEQTWKNAAPAGYSAASPDALTFMSPKRTIDGLSQNALRTIKAGAPDAWMVVTDQAVPWVGLKKVMDNVYDFEGWLYCGKTAVSLAWSDIDDFAMDQLMGTDGTFTPVPTESTRIPVGLLVNRTGNWGYVAPAAS